MLSWSLFRSFLRVRGCYNTPIFLADSLSMLAIYSFCLFRYMLHVRFMPEDIANWLPAEMEIEFNVLPQKIPKLTWYEPAPLVHPAPLDRAQVCYVLSLEALLA
jgi:hypothetical protein